MPKIRMTEIPKKAHIKIHYQVKLRNITSKRSQLKHSREGIEEKILTESSSSFRTNSLGTYGKLKRKGTFSRCIYWISQRKTNDLSFGALILRMYGFSKSFSTKSSSNVQLEIKLSNVSEDNVTNFNISLINLLNLLKKHRSCILHSLRYKYLNAKQLKKKLGNLYGG